MMKSEENIKEDTQVNNNNNNNDRTPPDLKPSVEGENVCWIKTKSKRSSTKCKSSM